jgi:hypothetical protein
MRFDIIELVDNKRNFNIIINYSNVSNLSKYKLYNITLSKNKI